MSTITFNRFWQACRPFAEVAEVITPDEMGEAASVIGAWPEYRSTPLVPLRGLSKRLGLGAVFCKNEALRFGLGGVKALGAPYGLLTTMQATRARTVGRRAPEAVAATDGNHGLALAWAVRRFGGTARIFVGSGVNATQARRLRAAGAVVIRIAGTYDDAVHAAEVYASAAPERLLVSDTDYTGELPVTRAIMAGYSLLGGEIVDQLGEERLTHIFLQCGVGGMAAGMLAGLWHRLGRLDARVVLVEPRSAACLQASLAAGRETAVEGELESRMVGLSCGRPSRLAWLILRKAAFAAIAIDEDTAVRTQRQLLDGGYDDPPFAAGDTGVAGIAGLVAAANSDMRDSLYLGRESRVLVINTEAAPQQIEAFAQL